MSDPHPASVERLLREIGAQMPMSEAEFRFRVEPLRASPDRSVRALIALLRADPMLRDVAIAALHEVARPSDAELLAAAFRDRAHAAPVRAEIAQVLTAIAADRLEELLEPEEIHDLSLLSIDTLLDRLREGPGLAQVVELYAGSSEAERRALLDALDAATRRPQARVRFGAALDALFDHEPDESLRASMITRLAQRNERSSARALQRWLAQAHGEERRRLLGALRKLGHLGIRPGPRSLEAWVSGTDATGSFNVGIAFPAALDLRDVVLACVHVDAGLRAVNVITAVAPDTVREIERALEEGQSIPVASIDVPGAIRLIDEARERARSLGRALPDGYAAAAPYLRRPLAVAEARPRPLPTSHATRGQIEALAEVPPYASWGFGEAEVALPEPAEEGEALSTRRLHQAVRATLRRLESSGGARRLIAMLEHQSEVHRLRSEAPLAARSLAAAREIAERGLSASALARRLVERSIVARVVHGPRAPRADVRPLLRHAIEERFAIRRRAVAILDLAEALYRQLENASERSPITERLTPAQMEVVARSAAEACVAEFSRDASDQSPLPGLESAVTIPASAVRARLEAESGASRVAEVIERQIEGVAAMPPETAARLASALAATGRWFAAEVCLRLCRQRCLRQPEADGRALFFRRSHPAGLDDAGRGDEPAASRSPEGVALRRHMAQRLDDRIATARSFVEALGLLRVVPPDLAPRLRRTEEIVGRLERLRREVEGIEEDPAWIYALVEESEALIREFRALLRHLLGSALGALAPRAEQFAGFRVYPEALAAAHRLQREMHRIGLVGLSPRALRAAADRLPGAAALLALLRGLADPMPHASLVRFEAALAEFWRHTPRSELGGRTPALLGAETTPAARGRALPGSEPGC